MKKKSWGLYVLLCFILLAGCEKSGAEECIEPNLYRDAGLKTEQETETETGQRTGQETGQRTGQETGQRTGQETGQRTGQGTGQGIGQRTEQGTEQRIESSTVKISAGPLMGSGVIYKLDEEFVWIVTAGHVLEQAAGKAEITFSSGERVPSLSYRKEDHFDVAYIKVDRTLLTKVDESICAVVVDKAVFDQITRGDQVCAVGYQRGTDYMEVSGTLQDSWIFVDTFEQNMMVANLTIVDGMSGGGVFDENGIFLGILCGASVDGEAAILPYSVIDGMWE